MPIAEIIGIRGTNFKMRNNVYSKHLPSIAVLFLVLASGPLLAANAQGPNILKRTVVVTPHRFLRWWKVPTAAEPVYDTWSWAPKIRFAINGPVASGSQIYVDFETADGKLWFSQRMQTPTLEADFWEDVKNAEDMDFDQLEKKAITATTGTFGFKIRLKNALAGADTVLFSGKYKISTYAPDQKIPEYRGKKEFYIDEDWRLPMAWLWMNPVDNEDGPIMNAQIWFKNSENNDNIEAFLFYNGKQIASNRSLSTEDTLTNGVDERPYRYTLRTFYFATVRTANGGSIPDAYRDAFFIDKNPGDYEIKVLRNGELTRSLKFTVGPDKTIADNGIVKINKIGGIRMLTPIKIVGPADGKFSSAAWQTDAFYGNPLAGFTAVQ